MSTPTDPAKSVIILCISGPDRDKRLAVSGQPAVIGRAAQCNVLSDDPDVAERHASFRAENGRIHFDVIDSAVIFVDGQSSKSGVLDSRQQLRLGRSQRLFERRHGPAAYPAGRSRRNPR